MTIGRLRKNRSAEGFTSLVCNLRPAEPLAREDNNRVAPDEER